MRNVLQSRTRDNFIPRSAVYTRGPRDAVLLNTVCCFIALAGLVIGVLYGTLLLLLFMLAFAALLAASPGLAVRDIAKFMPILALPLLAMLSTLWSDSPERTLRAALQMLLTMTAAIVICRRISAETFVLMMFIAMACACAIAAPAIPRAIAEHRPLLGPYASKNAMAYAALLLVGLSLGVLFENARSIWWRLIAFLTIPAGIVLIVLAQSAGAFVSLALFSSSFLALWIVGRTTGPWRLVFLAMALAGAGLALAILPDIESAVADFRQNVLHKDATLTGRTYLWEFAYRLVADRPLLGHGYYAFWRVGNIDAEGLWRRMGIASRTGFNFHNTFIEMLVDMGWVGTIVLILTCGGIALAGLIRQFTRPSTAMAFLLALTITELVRATTETTLFAPFSYYTVLITATAVYAFAPSPRASVTAGALPRNRTARHAA